MTSTPNKPADAYLGLLFCMEDMALYVLPIYIPTVPDELATGSSQIQR
jgi:hypothetical protein